MSESTSSSQTLTPEEQQALIEHWRTHGFDLPIDNPAAFYDEDYWSRAHFRRYPIVELGGNIRIAEYLPPSAEWGGFAPLLEGLWEALGERPHTLLDIGCGCGSLVGAARRQGIDAVGMDISVHGIEHPVPDAQGHVYLGDVREPGASRPAEVVTATDLMEHIHEPDLDGVIKGLLQLTQRHLVLCICVARRPCEVWSHVPGEPVPLEKAWLAVSGHVTIRPHAWWVHRFMAGESDGWFHVNWRAMHRFAQFMSLHPQLKQVESWSPANILILTRND